jgi:beta-N-acetylhexosaminidase
MKDDAQFRLSVREAARRVLTLKLKYLKTVNKVPYIPDLRRVEAELPDPEGSAFFLNLAARSVTIVETGGPALSPSDIQSGKSSVFPLKPDNAGRVLLAGQYGDFFAAGRAAFPSAVSFRYSNSQNSSELINYARNADTVIFCLSDAAGLRILRGLEPLKKRVIVLSVLSPIFLESVPWVNGAAAIYSYAPESFTAGFSAITGRISAGGKLPYE